MLMDNVRRDVMPREGHGSRNPVIQTIATVLMVMPREGHGSRNKKNGVRIFYAKSCPARGMGVEISCGHEGYATVFVMPREGHGSRNRGLHDRRLAPDCHAPRGAWE